MKTVILLTVLLLLQFVGLAQSAQVADPEPLRLKLNAIFANISRTPISTGFLEEYGAPLIPLDPFNGVLSDSNKVDIKTWRMAYGTLWSSRIASGSNPLITLFNVNTAIKNAEAATTAIPVPMIYIEYNAIKPTAISENLLRVQNDQLFDVAGRPQSPYLKRAAFLAAPSLGYAATGTPSFIFKQELFYKLSSKTFSTIQVNFNDGRGYLNASWNAPIAANYTSIGKKPIKIKLRFTDGTSVECYSEIEVTSLGTAHARFANPNLNRDFDALVGIHRGGRASVEYSVTNTTGRLRRPFIVIEGFDVSTIAPLIQDRNFDFFEIIRKINEQPTPYNFNTQLDDVAGYDLVFLDFNDGAADIIGNAALLREVITWINEEKTANGSNEQNVIIGMSMGGLVARYALAEMTKLGLPTQTRLLITHDTPHRGANVPIGFQALVRAANETTIVQQGLSLVNLSPQLEQAVEVLQSPAAIQMLISRATNGTGTFVANTFLNDSYRRMVTFTTNDPQPTYRVIGTSQGSQCGVGSLAPGAQLFSLSGNFFLSPRPWVHRRSIKMEAIVNALPTSGTSRVSKLRVWANYRILSVININMDLANKEANSPGNMLPWDGAPGGTQSVADQLGGGLPSINFRLGIFLELTSSSTAADAFCFVPTVSALDVQTLNATTLFANYVNGLSNNQARVATFVAQEQFIDEGGVTRNNQSHYRFTRRNAEWMFREMQNPAANNSYCTAQCGGTFGATISGPTSLCFSNVTYTANNVPPGSTITWSHSSNVVYVSGQSTTSFTVRGNGTGTGHVQFTLQNICQASPPFRLNLVLNAPTPPILGPTEVNNHTTYQYNTTLSATSYEWAVTNGQIVGGQGTNQLSVKADCIPEGFMNVSLRIITTCGTSPWNVISVGCSPEDQGLLAISSAFPNPVNETLTIKTEKAGPKEITLRNTFEIIRQETSDEVQLDLDVRDLPAGIYYLIIMQDGFQKSHRIIIN